MNVIYKCSKCIYLFERRGAVERCPDCGSVNFTEAGPEDCAEYAALRKQFAVARESAEREERP